MSGPRTRSPLGPHLAGIILALVALVGCQISPQTTSQPPTGDAPVATDSPAATTGDGSAVADAIDQSASELTPPAPPPTPSPRPTPRPLPTPIPPSQALEPAATALQAKLGAFRAALKNQDVSNSLRVQRDLLSAASDAESAIKADKSPQAQSVRGAIAEIRAGIAGDNNGLDHADSALRQVIGGGSGGLGVSLTSDSSSNPVGDLHSLNVDMHDFRRAIQSKNAPDALRLQGKLLAEIGAVQKVAASDTSDDNTAVSDALAILQKGLDGDVTALATAGDALDKLDTGPGQTPSTPDYAGLAASLAAKMDAFETATATSSQADVLRLQQEILNEATQDESALGSDQSVPATALRDAIKSARTSVSGDLTKVDAARADLGKVSGQSVASGSSTAKPITDIKGFARDLDATIGSFQDALQRNDTSSMLRLQKSLADQSDQADVNLKGVQSKPAQQVLAAIGAIRSAFAGDTSKLADARVQLRQVSGASPASPASAVPAQPAQPSNSGFDAQAILGGVRDKLTSLNSAVHDPHQSSDEIAKRRDALNAEALKAQSALNGVSNPSADRLRSALTTAREAAAGDDGKVQTALTNLQTALDGH
jgi:hypothetical protein